MKNKYEIRGDKAVIFLRKTDGTTLKAMIDLSDLEKAQSIKGTWHANKLNYVRGYDGSDGYNRVILHRFILDAPKGYHVDHINHNPLDNTRANLRVVTQAENYQNTIEKSKTASSGIRGLYWNKNAGKWEVKIRCEYFKFTRLFNSKEEAINTLRLLRKEKLPYSQEVI